MSSAVLDGRAAAGAIGSPFWQSVRAQRLVPEGALTEVWTSSPYNHCMFTAQPDFEPRLERRFAEAPTESRASLSFCRAAGKSTRSASC